MSARGTDPEAVQEDLDRYVGELRDQLADILFGEEDGEALEATLAKLFTARGATLATAESCTGGAIAAQLTAVPGASNFFLGSVVSYATEVKKGVLGVDPGLIEAHSVVSPEVAGAMAEGARKLLGADIAVATTGNAGPAKGESDAAVGTVAIAVSGPGGTRAEVFTMGNHRERIVRKSVHKAFEMLREEILKF